MGVSSLWVRGLLLAWVLVLLNPVLAMDESGPVPDGGVIVGFRDDFNDVSRVAASSNISFTGAHAELTPVTANWTREGLVLDLGGGFDSANLGGPAVLHEGPTYKMWYFGTPNGADFSIGYATSSDGRSWTRQGVVLSASLPPEGSSVNSPEVLRIGSEYRMWYTGYDGIAARILAATSSDGVSWTKQGVVLDLSPTGSLDDRFVYEPSVVYDGALYRMYYNGLTNADSLRRMFLATSSDGLSWMKQGPVLTPGPPGSLDDIGAQDGTVRPVFGGFEMIYAGVTGSGSRFFRATSTDGLVWQKQGLVLNHWPPDESSVLATPFLLPEADGSWKLYYESRGSTLKIFLAVRPEPPLAGWLTSIPIAIPGGLDWAWFNQTASVPQGTWLNVTVRDAATLTVVGGLENITAGSIDLSGVDSSVHSQVVLEARLTRSGLTSPSLDAWEISWSDWQPPTFAGLSAATDVQTGGRIRLSWPQGSDPSGPVTYNVYMTTATTPFDFGAPAFSTSILVTDVAGLVDGTTYRFIVRSFDRWGNEDTNLAERSAIPTTPVDDTPPSFGGIQQAQDSMIGGTVQISWSAATDPDTVKSNSDPSLPISYLVFLARAADPIDYQTPVQTTQSLAATVSGLSDGIAYKFAVRARDAAGNTEANDVTMSAVPTTPLDGTPPVFAGLEQASDAGTGGSVTLSWSAAMDPDKVESNSDPSIPIDYLVYYAPTPDTIDFGNPRLVVQNQYATVSGLTDGILYSFAVRTRDGAQNVDLNVITRIATPTTPEDRTPPEFGGVRMVIDLGSGTEIRVVWDAANDPDTAASNADPSLPIRYEVYVAESIDGLETTSPQAQLVGQTTVEIHGLKPGVRYYVLVRAIDDAGNRDANMVIQSLTLATPISAYLPVVLPILLAVIATLVMLIILRRRRRQKNERKA